MERNLFIKPTREASKMKCNECKVKAPTNDVCNKTYLIKQFKNIFLCNHCTTKTHSWITYRNQILGGK